jgi:hypothetical protein
MIAAARAELRCLALARAVTVLPEETIIAADIRHQLEPPRPCLASTIWQAANPELDSLAVGGAGAS